MAERERERAVEFVGIAQLYHRGSTGVILSVDGVKRGKKERARERSARPCYDFIYPTRVCNVA